MPDQPRSWLQGNIGVKPAPIRLSALRTDAHLTPRTFQSGTIALDHGLTPFPQRDNAHLHATAGRERIDQGPGPAYWPGANASKRTMSAPSTHLVIADDHPLFRDALRQAVAGVLTSARIDEAGSFEDLTKLLEQTSDVDLVLLDLSMPGISGFSGLIYLRAQYPAIPVVIVSASDDSATIRRSLDFGASGFIPKQFGVETLRDAILKVMEGDVWVPTDTDLSAAADPDMTRLRDRLVTLTPQQVRVLMMLSEGLLNKQIAYELGVSEATIKAHVSAILQKLGVESRTQAVIAAAKIAGGQWKQGNPTGS